MKKKILVFPCGSEIALEIYRSLKNSIHFDLIGANSVPDHGRFVFEDYIPDVPYANDKNFIPAIKKIVEERHIDFIYPAMDSVITVMKENEDTLGCPVIASPVETTEICLSKSKTYDLLKDTVHVPKSFTGDESDLAFPLFGKPDVGYGARGTKKITSMTVLEEYRKNNPDSLILEYLPGDEYTVDCFTSSSGELLYAGARKRNRISNGISVSTITAEDQTLFQDLAAKINSKLNFRGAWFVQFKMNKDNEPVLLEIASRFGGSSAHNRAKGINFAQLSLFDAMGIKVSIIENSYSVEMDRALDNRYKLGLEYDEVFMDYDDTVILEGKYYNPDIMKFIFICKNKGIKLTLLSAHDGDLDAELDRFGIRHLFDRIIHSGVGVDKSGFIDNEKAIFIDDSFAERKNIMEKKHIPVFSLDMIETLI